jgi:two-component system sensor kinase FixL
MNPENFEKHFQDLFNNTTDLIQFVGTNAQVELVNPAWLHTLEYELYEIVGRKVYDFIHPEYADAYKNYREKAIATGQVLNIKTVFVSKPGNHVFVEGQITAFVNDDNTGYTRAVFENITQRRLAEKKLGESEKRLNIFFKRAPDAVIIINEQQQILEWNPKAEVIFGFTAEEVIGKPLSETIVPLQFREAHKKGMSHFLKTGEGPVLNKTIEITALHKNGKEFYISLSISNVQVDGEWLFVVFLSDISERKKTEEELIYKEAELLQARLLEQKKDEFICIASHELRTPLTTIKAYAQLALTCCEGTNEKAFEYLNKIDQFTNKLNGLIGNLLDVSRIQSGKLQLNLTTVELGFFLAETLHSLQHIVTSHKIVFRQNANVITTIDILRMEQVISNIVSNAAKYSPGKDVIQINLQVKNNEAIISVTDYGIGIPKENIDNIFGRFYRVNEDFNQFSGLGIGLYVSSEIIIQHGGKIWAESELTKGSTFYISLPIQH